MISRNLSISRKNSEYFSDFMTVGINSRIEENIDFTENIWKIIREQKKIREMI